MEDYLKMLNDVDEYLNSSKQNKRNERQSRVNNAELRAENKKENKDISTTVNKKEEMIEKPKENTNKKLDLIPRVTVIGNIEGRYEGIYRKFEIRYGNVANPVINNNVLHLQEDIYLKMLKNFLSSDAGKNYRIPSDSEIKQVIKDIINEETELMLNRKKEEEEMQKQEKALRQEEEVKRLEEEKELRQKELAEQKRANDLKSIELDTFKKKIKRQRIFNIILLVLTTLLIFLNVYLISKGGLI